MEAPMEEEDEELQLLPEVMDLPFQRAWVEWATDREQEYGGGILADEFGMGKRIQAVLLAASDEDPTSKTLIICPEVSTSEWRALVLRVDRRAKVKELINHKGEDLSGCKFAITSYEDVRGFKHVTTCPHCEATLRSSKVVHFCDKKKQPARRRQSMPLESVEWKRIFLDEGHVLRGDDRCIYGLKSLHRWILTGRLKDFCPLLRFLRVYPDAFYHCQNCTCSSLDLGVWAKCPSCRHKSTEHIHWLQNYGTGIIGQLALRRSKEDITPEFDFPPKNVIVKRYAPSGQERDMYRRFKGIIRKEFEGYVETGSVMENYERVLELIKRLKQASMHKDLADNSNDCLHCLRELRDATILPCKHAFCRDCLLKNFPPGRNIMCILCELDTKVCSRNLALCTSLKPKKKQHMPKGTTSIPKGTCTRIEALKEELASQTDTSAKGVIFSTYSNFLDLVCTELTESGIGCVSFCNPEKAESALKLFNDDGGCKYLLTTFELGGSSVDLSAASMVYVMDPTWNPVVDKQAEDRVHSIGQLKPTRIVKFIAERTIDERILALVEQRRDLLAGLHFHHGEEDLEKLRQEDISFLLG